MFSSSCVETLGNSVSYGASTAWNVLLYINYTYFPYLLPPSSLTLFPDKTFRPAYNPLLARFVTPRVNAISPNGMVLDLLIKWQLRKESWHFKQFATFRAPNSPKKCTKACQVFKVEPLRRHVILKKHLSCLLLQQLGAMGWLGSVLVQAVIASVLLGALKRAGVVR
jgi:hypothetical protein